MYSSTKSRRVPPSAVSFIISLSVGLTGAGGSDAAICEPESPAVCLAAAEELEVDGASAADRAQAVALYRRVCEWGHPAACVRAGHRLRNGVDVTHEPDVAAELFRAACDEGNAEACNMLGIMYAGSEGGLTADPVRSRRLYDRSCNGSWGWGCNNLAENLRDGKGGDQDLAGAATNFRTACEAGIAGSCNSLGNLYWEGKGVEQDRLRANVYYSKGCDGDAAWACYNVATSYRSGDGVLAKDPAQAVTLLRKACELGAARACNLAGVMYHDGETGAKDFLLAFGLFHKACDDGYDWGCRNTASMYRNGTGIGRDEARADALDRRACDGGIADACEEIGATSEAAAARATPTPTAPQPPTATPTPRPQPTPTPTPPPGASRWQRNCQVVWKSSNELVYTVTMNVDDDGDEETSLHAERSDLLALVNELDTTDEPELERASQIALREIEGAPGYDNPVPSFLGGSSADMTITPAVDTALGELWEAVGRRAKAAGEACP